jgi:predicted RNA-binding Zn-ribbon protein involved in translation (DUF1610 family)
MPSELWSDDEDDWSETGDDDLDDADSLPCPECGKEIYADLEYCPACGHWITETDHRTRGTGTSLSPTVRAVAMLMIAIMLALLFGGLVAMF